MPSTRRLFSKSLKANIHLLITLLGIMWALEILDTLPGFQLDRFGIQPRTMSGLLGIVLAPFLHSDFPHLIANSLPFLILGAVVLMGGRRVFWSVSIFCALAGGLGVWLVGGSHTLHVGASGLIFGYLGFLLARGFVEKSWPWIGVALVIGALYGWLLFGVLPTRGGVSWEGHLFGFLAGIGAARRLFAPAARRARPLC